MQRPLFTIERELEVPENTQWVLEDSEQVHHLCCPMIEKVISLKTNLKKIKGNWNKGYALDKHTLWSKIIDHDEFGHPKFYTQRTEVGEAVYQLKYKYRWDQIDPLVNSVVEKIVPKFAKIDLVVPVPASEARRNKPVYDVSREIAKRLGVICFDDIVIRTPTMDGQEVELKNLNSKEEKVAVLAGRFSINDGIPDEGRGNVLVVDDLFQTGATMEAVCSALRSYRKIDKIFVATLSWRYDE